MPAKRALSLWFPRLGAESVLRKMGASGQVLPLVMVADSGQMQVVASVSVAASLLGVRPGQPLRDAQAICPDLVTRSQAPGEMQAFLALLRRWATRFSPWVAEQPPDALMLDITGCAHLFGGEQAMATQMQAACARQGLSLQYGIADTPGAAWALARYGGQEGGGPVGPSGQVVLQEARATRARAAPTRRGWARSTSGPAVPPAGAGAIAPPGGTFQALAGLPLAALRLDPAITEGLARLGLRQVGDLMQRPRAGLARRFGPKLLLRLDQALGAAPEPISPAQPQPVLATRLTFPDPIGLPEDIAAGVQRLVQRLCHMLQQRGQGARVLRLQAFRADGTAVALPLVLAQAMADPARILPLLALRLPGLAPGYGIDVLRLAVVQAEVLPQRQHAGHAVAGQVAQGRAAGQAALEDLIGRLGARLGPQAVTRLHPVDTHIPEKEAQPRVAAFCAEAGAWPLPPRPRPLLLCPRPEPLTAPALPQLPGCFRWRRRSHVVAHARGPERIAPEWWLDDPQWRSGTRDYWDITTQDGLRLWVFFAHGGALSAGWFCHGSFA
jgi:protein ImuB